ncbi:MAG: glycosyltransferase family 39 protein [Candidatus Shapirobacteria bacterium]|nr:glycosyltransferase family 39 protein [Candidatus Shapirobacteria bacterium]MDD5481762.1 glycosyltransferase family 39 protein [Candidatus Shapirobacteria bacterium]
MKLHSRAIPLFLLLIFALGFTLRAYRLYDYSEFSYDPARDTEIIRQIVQEGKLTLLGPPTSVSVPDVPYGTTYFGPVFYYLLAPFLPLFSYDPYGPVLAIAFLGAVGILLVFAIVKKLTNHSLSALLASLTLAVSEGAIFYSRWIWNPNLMPLFILLLLFFLVGFQEKKNRLLLFFSGGCLGIIIQLHFIAYFLFFLPVWVLLLDYFSSRNKKGFFANLLFLFLGFLLAILPMILFEVRHDFLNTRSIVYNLTLENHPNGDNLGFSVGNIGLVAKTLFTKFLGLNNFWLILLTVLVLTVFSFAFFKNKKYSLISLYFFVGIFGSAIFNHRGGLDARYVIPVFPVLFILFGLIFHWLFFSKRPAGLFLGLMLLVVFIVPSLFSVKKSLGFPARHSLKFFRDISQIIIDDYSATALGVGKSFNLAVLADGLGRRGVSFRYFFHINNVNILDEFSYPAADILYVVDDQYGWSGIINNTDTWEVYSFEPKNLERIILAPYGKKIYKITK